MGMLRKFARVTLVTASAAVVLVAVGVGAFLLLVRQLPNYQGEIQSWVTAELGLELDYTQLDAAWGWRGPELEFHNVRVRAAGDAAPFLTARSASVGLNALDLAFRLVTGRELAVDRLTFDGTELTLVHGDDGGYRLQGAPAQAARAQTAVQVPPDIEVLVRNSRVLYLDAARSVAWDFQDVAGGLRRVDDVLTIEASARPPADFADRIEVTAQAFVADDGERRGSPASGAYPPISTTSISPSPRACSRPRPSPRKRAAATWRFGSIGRRARSRAAPSISRSPT